MYNIFSIEHHLYYVVPSHAKCRGILICAFCFCSLNMGTMIVSPYIVRRKKPQITCGVRFENSFRVQLTTLKSVCIIISFFNVIYLGPLCSSFFVVDVLAVHCLQMFHMDVFHSPGTCYSDRLMHNRQRTYCIHPLLIKPNR